MRRIICLLALGSFVQSAQAADQADTIDRGRYQAILGDCAACHTKVGATPLAGGEPIDTPFGALIPPNITQDKETGIGNWSKNDFIRMMRSGVGHNGVRLYPAMPYPAYTKMRDQDLSDLWDYLTTVEPVSNKVEANQLPFPFSIRLSMWGWNLLNFTPERFTPNPEQSVEWNRGAYLVEGAAHCGTCHSPKNLLGADKNAQFLQGASLQGWYAPNITGDPSVGIGSWSKEELVRYLKSGVNHTTVASGPMAEAIQNSTSLMTDADLNAMAAYLKSLPSGSVDRPTPLPPSDPRMLAGSVIYHDTCSACHGMDGKGAMPLFPALSGNPIVQQSNVETLAHVVLAGSQGVHTPTAVTTPSMPSLSWRLDDQQIADVLNFIRNTWGNSGSVVTPNEVAAVRGEQ